MVENSNIHDDGIRNLLDAGMLYISHGSMVKILDVGPPASLLHHIIQSPNFTVYLNLVTYSQDQIHEDSEYQPNHFRTSHFLHIYYKFKPNTSFQLPFYTNIGHQPRTPTSDLGILQSCLSHATYCILV